MVSYAMLCYLMLSYAILSDMCRKSQKNKNLISKILPDPSRNPSKSTQNRARESSWAPLGGVGTVCRNDGFRHTVFCRNLVALDPPRPLSKPLQIHPKSSPRELLGVSWGLLRPLGHKALKKEAKKPRSKAQQLQTPSQKRPKTLPTHPQNR